MFQSIINCLIPTKYYGKKSFTYFLPAPPERNTGYQEKEFDQIISFLQQKGYELININTQAVNYGESSQSAGLWIVCTLGLLEKSLVNQELNIDYLEISKNTKSKIEMDPDIIHD